jgi:hypothetical protein
MLPVPSIQYRALADESREMAKLTIDATTKSELMERAARYERLAEELEYWSGFKVKVGAPDSADKDVIPKALC